MAGSDTAVGEVNTPVECDMVMGEERVTTASASEISFEGDEPGAIATTEGEDVGEAGNAESEAGASRGLKYSLIKDVVFTVLETTHSND